MCVHVYMSVCVCVHVYVYLCVLVCMCNVVFFAVQDWEKRYIHVNYSKVLKDDYNVEQVNNSLAYMDAHYTHEHAHAHTHTIQ